MYKANTYTALTRCLVLFWVLNGHANVVNLLVNNAI